MSELSELLQRTYNDVQEKREQSIAEKIRYNLSQSERISTNVREAHFYKIWPEMSAAMVEAAAEGKPGLAHPISPVLCEEIIEGSEYYVLATILVAELAKNDLDGKMVVRPAFKLVEHDTEAVAFGHRVFIDVGWLI